MKITVDTNVLVRAVSDDDVVQSPVARKMLEDATAAIVPLVVLGEFDWVMRKFYGYPRRAVHAAIENMLLTPNVVMDTNAVRTGLAFLDAGGDFADGIIAFDGRRLGGGAFASFDVKARKIAAATGFSIVPVPDAPPAG